MSQNFSNLSFDLEMPSWYKKNNEKIMGRIISDLKSGKQFNYLFVGKVGTGKTTLASEIYRQARYYYPLTDMAFLKARELYQDYLAKLGCTATDKSEAIKKSLRCFRSSFAVLDDLGAEKPRTDASRVYIESILEDRYEWIKKFKSSTIITTNLTGTEIGELYGTRVLDRIHEVFTIMIFNDHNFRQEQTEIIEG